MTKPIKGPVVLAPLEPQSIWSPPNTPVTTSPVTQTPVNNTTPVANTALAPVTNTFQQQQFSALQPQQQQPINNFNGFSPTPIPLQNPGRPTTAGATAPVGPMQTAPQAFVSPPIAPNSIIREQRAPIQTNPSPIQTNPSPIQTSPTKASPAQQIRDSFNSIKETFQIQKKDSAQSLQSNDNDFIPKAPLIQNVQTATAPQAQTPSQPEKIHKASTIASEVALADFGKSPSQQLIKQAGFVEPTTTPVTKQDDFSVPFEAGKVVAIVGGEPIFVGDMLFEVNQIVERFIGKASEEVKQRERQKLIPKILPKFIESRLLYQGMLTQLPEGVEVENVIAQAAKEFDAKAMPGMMKAAGVESVTDFDAYLRSLGSSLRNMRETWGRDQMTKYFLVQKIGNDTDVTREEMLQNYRENIDSYNLDAKARWEQIMIRFDKSDSKETARAEIERLSNQIIHGANLAAVAKKSSHGFLASEGGQQNWTSKDSLVLKEIDEAIFTLPRGALSNIIETKDGFHIVRVLERNDAGRTPFVDAQVDIKNKIIGERRKAAYDKYLAELRERIPVEYMINDESIARLNGQQDRR